MTFGLRTNENEILFHLPPSNSSLLALKMRLWQMARKRRVRITVPALVRVDNAIGAPEHSAPSRRLLCLQKTTLPDTYIESVNLKSAISCKCCNNHR